MSLVLLTNYCKLSSTSISPLPLRVVQVLADQGHGTAEYVFALTETTIDVLLKPLSTF